ncbi:MAG TPA: dNTP triphosphohydrolase [Conexibacter sp.]|nr:dNTP triphosphohydrolase [Conexibacter sp.]
MSAPAVDGYSPHETRRLHRDEEETDDPRSPFARDYDRLLYTPELRRLQGKTQVVAAGEAGFFRTRLTHTLEVAQVARRLAECINRRASGCRDAAGVLQWIDDPAAVKALPAEQQKVDPDLVESAALLHDLGHPPFAHVGESALSAAVGAASERHGIENSGLFDGNAQSFRLAVKTLSHHGEARGLQLTYATLDASAKYPWTVGDPAAPSRSKWSVNPTEWGDLLEIRCDIPEPLRYEQTLEAGIMDWADDVAYSVHDLDDWNRAGYMPLARLANDDGEQERVARAVAPRLASRYGKDLDELAERIRREIFALEDGPFEEFRRQREARQPIFDPTSGAARRAVRRLRGSVFDDAMTRFAIVRRDHATADAPRRIIFRFAPDPDVCFKVDVLKTLLRHYVIDDARLATQQHGHRAVITQLFEVHERAVCDGQLRLFPADLRRHLEGETDPRERLRSVVDHVARLTDQEALRLHERLRTGGGRLHDYA